MKIDVSVIVINYKTPNITVECLETLYKHTKGVNIETILIDNSPGDYEVKLPSKFQKKKNFRIIRNPKNVGFGAANNQGIKLSKGRYVLLLNSDTLLKSDSISEMVKFMDGKKNAAIASCKLLNDDLTDQSSGGYFPTLVRVGAWMSFIDDIPGIRNLFKSFHPKPFSFRKPTKVDWVMGSFFLIRKEAIAEIGEFDKDYFMYTEEVDYCFRAKKLGWQVWYVPTTSIIHLGGASSDSEFVITNEFKGITIYYKKHCKFLSQIILKIFLFIGIILRMIIFGVLRGSNSFRIYRNSLKFI